MNAQRKRPHIRLRGHVGPDQELELDTPAMLRPIRVYELELVAGGNLWLTSFRVGDAEQLVEPGRASSIPLRAMQGVGLVFDVSQIGTIMHARVWCRERAPRELELRLYYHELPMVRGGTS